MPEPSPQTLEGDRCLARAIGRRDENAFEDFVNRFSPRVFRIASRYFRQRETVEETAQEVFLKAFANIESYRGEMPLEHWISRIAVNACYDSLRRRQARPESLESELLGADQDAGEFFQRLASRNSAPDA